MEQIKHKENKDNTNNTNNTNRGASRKMKELHRLPLMIFAWLFPLFLVKDMATGILLGAGTLLAFLMLEGSGLLFGKCLAPVLRTISYLLMALSLSAIVGILLQLVQTGEANAPFYCFILEQMASIYLLKAMLNGAKETKEVKKAEEGDGEETETEMGKKDIWKALLPCFEIAVKYTIFLGIFGLLREYISKWVVSAGLFSGGLLITAGLLFVWKLTKTMPERFEKLPGMTLSVGLLVLVFAGFAGLL